MPRLFSKFSTALSLTLLICGCYTFAPAEPESVLPGETVRTRISPDEAGRLAEFLGGTDPVLEGTILERVSGGVLLDVTVATRQVGFHFEPMSQRVQVGIRRDSRDGAEGIGPVENRGIDRRPRSCGRIPGSAGTRR